MRVLITGGAGYLGSVVTPHLLREGHEVTVLDSFIFNQNSLADCCADERFSVVRGDCRDETLVKGLVAKADAVIPLAARVGAPLCDSDRAGAQSTNADAVKLICRLSSPRQLILLPMTNSGYGIGEKDKPCTEDSPLRPVSFYGRTKVEAESAVLERENSVTFRLATVFGMSPRMRIDLLVNDFVYRAVHDRAVVVFEGHFRRNYVHIRDIARLFSHALTHFSGMKGKAFNVGLDDANLSKLQLCARIQKALPKFVFMEAATGEDPDKRDYVVSNARLAAAGFRTEKTLDDGIRELIKGFTILRNARYGNW